MTIENAEIQLPDKYRNSRINISVSFKSLLTFMQVPYATEYLALKNNPDLLKDFHVLFLAKAKEQSTELLFDTHRDNYDLYAFIKNQSQHFNKIITEKALNYTDD